MRKATSGIDYTNRDYRAYKEMMINFLQSKIPEYTDTSETDAGIVILEALANGLDICSYYSETVANDVMLATTQDRRLACLLARNLGYEPYPQTASVIPVVFRLNEEQPEDVLIPRGTMVTTEESSDSEPVPFETIEDIHIPSGAIGDEKDDDGNYIYSVNAKQGETITEDFLGSSTGNPYQTFQLTYPSVLLDSIEIYVDEGDGEKLWRRVTTFVDYDSTDCVYTVTFDEYDNCFIQFGSGIKGKIPTVYDDGIRASYRIGGGVIGNVKENTVTVIETEVACIEECFNLEPIVQGHEKETLEDIKYNAPAANRVRDRAVTLQDYDDLIKMNVSNYDLFYGILNTKTLRNKENGMQADIYYQMREGYSFSDSLRDMINSFLAPRIMVGTLYSLQPYVDYRIHLSVSIVVKRDYDTAEVTEAVKGYLRDYFHYGNLTFGSEVIKTDIEDEVRRNVTGVKSFRIDLPEDDIIIADTENGIISIDDEIDAETDISTR